MPINNRLNKLILLFLFTSTLIISIFSIAHANDELSPFIRNPDAPPQITNIINPIVYYESFIDLLRNKQYQKLEDKLDAISQTYIANPSKSNEYELYMAYNAFDADLFELDNYLQDWLITSPNKYQAQIANSIYYIDKAWKIRGRGYIKTVKKDNVKPFEDTLKLANKFALQAIKLNSKNSQAYLALVKSICPVDMDYCLNKLPDYIKENVPQSYYAHRILLNYTTPRWTGDAKITDMYYEAYIKPEVTKYPYLAGLKGFHDYDTSEAYYLDGKYDKALIYAKLALAEGNDYKYVDNIINIYTKLKNLDAANEWFRKRLELYPYSNEQYLKKELFLKEVEYSMEKQYHLSNYQQSLHFANIILSYLDNDANSLYLRGASLYSLAQIADAKKDLQKSCSINGQDACYYLMSKDEADNKLLDMLRVHNGNNDFASAVPILNDLLDKYPDNTGLLTSRGWCFINLKQFDKAEIDFRKLTKNDKHYLYAYQQLDHLLFDQGKLNDIIDIWAEYLKNNPNDAKAYLERSGTYYHLKNAQLSKQDAQKACDLGEKEGCKYAR